MEAAFYSYTAPEPAGLADTVGQGKIRPAQTFYSAEMKEFFLPYDDVRSAASPEETLMDFCQTTYEAGANLAGWDRAALERPSNVFITMGGGFFRFTRLCEDGLRVRCGWRRNEW